MVVLNSRNYLGLSHYAHGNPPVPIYPYGDRASDWNHSVHRGLSFSSDGGGSFSGTYHAQDLVDPVCEGAMVAGWDTPSTLGVVGNMTLFFTNPQASYARANLTLSMSVDGGCRWSEVLRVATGSTEYSSLVQFSDGTLGVAFDDGSGVESAHWIDASTRPTRLRDSRLRLAVSVFGLQVERPGAGEHALNDPVLDRGARRACDRAGR